MLLTLSFVLKPLFENKKIYFMVMFSLLGIIVGMRAESVGSDTGVYYQLFDSYASGSLIDILFNYDYENDEDIEIGTRLFIAISSIFSPFPQFFVFLASIVSYILYGIFLYRNTNDSNYWVSVSIIISMGFCFYSMSTLRQLLATAIAIQGVWFIKNRFYFKTFATVIIASMFHITAMIFLPIYFIITILRDKICNYNMMYVYCTCIAGILFSSYAIGTLIINNIDVLSPRTARYFLLSNIHSAGAENGLYFSSIIILYFIIIIIAALLSKRENKKEKVLIFLSLICLTVDCFCFILKENMRIILRLAYHFEPFAWLLISYVMTRISSKYVKTYVFFVFILISYITLNILGGLSINWDAVPYKFFFEV